MKHKNNDKKCETCRINYKYPTVFLHTQILIMIEYKYL